MECVKSVQRAALAALPADGAPYLAAGTVAGAVDAGFSSAATVELFGLDFRSDAADLPLLASAPAPDRFYRLRWSRPLAPEGTGSLGLGLLAGGLGDGTVALWNPRAMIRQMPPPPTENPSEFLLCYVRLCLICWFVWWCLQLGGGRSRQRDGCSPREAQGAGERCGPTHLLIGGLNLGILG